MPPRYRNREVIRRLFLRSELPDIVTRLGAGTGCESGRRDRLGLGREGVDCLAPYVNHPGFEEKTNPGWGFSIKMSC